MPVTVEQFNTGHMEALLRGIQTATVKFEKLETELERALEREKTVQAELDGSEKEVAALQVQVSELEVDKKRWDQLMDLIGDVDRGVREFSELTAIAKEFA